MCIVLELNRVPEILFTCQFGHPPSHYIFEGPTKLIEMETISDVRISSITSSNFVAPFRVHYNQVVISSISRFLTMTLCIYNALEMGTYSLPDYT